MHDEPPVPTPSAGQADAATTASALAHARAGAAAYIPGLFVKRLLSLKMPTREEMDRVPLKLRNRAFSWCISISEISLLSEPRRSAVACLVVYIVERANQTLFILPLVTTDESESSFARRAAGS